MNKIYYYVGRTNSGDAVSGKLEAENVEAVITYLSSRNITPLNIEASKKISQGTKKHSIFGISLTKIKPVHIMNLCRQLATLNGVGLPITKALDKLAKSTEINELKTALEIIAGNVAAGMTLSNALRKHPKIFSEIIINMVEVGENTGNLSESLIHLSKHIEASIDNRRRLVSAIRYPLFVVIASVTAMLVMNFLIIPKFADMFNKFNLELPLATRIIIASSNFLINNKDLLLFSLVGSLLLTKWMLTLPKIKTFWDRYKLYLPIFGSIQKRILVSQFAWAFSLILKAGIPIVKAIGLASGSVNNSYFSSQLLGIKKALEHGESFSTAAIHSNLFAPIVLQMIEIGEEGQSLDNTLYEVARHYDAEVDYELGRLNKLIEPILLVALGGIVLILVLGIYFPMWDLIKVAQI